MRIPKNIQRRWVHSIQAVERATRWLEIRYQRAWEAYEAARDAKARLEQEKAPRFTYRHMAVILLVGTALDWLWKLKTEQDVCCQLDRNGLPDCNMSCVKEQWHEYTPGADL